MLQYLSDKTTIATDTTSGDFLFSFKLSKENQWIFQMHTSIQPVTGQQAAQNFPGLPRKIIHSYGA